MLVEDQHNIQVLPRPDGKWEVIVPGALTRANFIGATKEEALDCAHEISRESGLKVLFPSHS